MGYVPDDSEWYVAELIMEITVHGGRCNVLHRNLRLIHARLPDEAYSKAVQLGKQGETEYINPKGQLVETRFRGISKLDVVIDPLEDGAELAWVEQLNVPESEIVEMIPVKEALEVFKAPTPGIERDPDYRSAAIVRTALGMVDTNQDD